MIRIDNAPVTKTESGVFLAIVDGTWFQAARVATKIQRVAGRKPVKIYRIMEGVFGVEVG
jgi:hypothetical protein